MPERLSPTALIQSKELLVRNLLISPGATMRFEARATVPGSSTSHLYSGVVEIDGAKIDCVLKIPDAEVAGSSFFAFVYGSSEGVRVALQAAHDDVAKPQMHSPEVAVVRVTQDGPNRYILSLDHDQEGEVGLLMLEVPTHQWLDQQMESILRENPDTWSQELTKLITRAIGIIDTLQRPAKTSDAESNHPNQISQWPITNGFERMLALYEGLESFEKLLIDVLDESSTRYLSKVDQQRAQILRDTFQMLVEKNSAVLEHRASNGDIVTGHGDAKVQNWITLPNDGMDPEIVALDGLRFFDSEAEACRPWHVRDKQWDTAFLSVTAALQIAKSKGVESAHLFLLHLENRDPVSNEKQSSERVALNVYALYSFYVQADTLLRISLSAINAGDFPQARAYFSEVSMVLELGNLYAENHAITSN